MHDSRAQSHPQFVLLSDAPPLRLNGYGCHVLVWNWLAHLRGQVRLVMTHRLNPALDPRQIQAELEVPCLFYPDLCRLGSQRFSRLKAALELGLYRGWLARKARQIRACGADRLFAFFGGTGRFLWIAEATARAVGLPLDVYLVDDLEESARLVGQSGLAKKYRRKEEQVLRMASRVFVISPGYVEHLQAKYEIAAQWLPLPMRDIRLEYRPFVPAQPDRRALAYLGAINPLYSAALRELLEVIAQWNAGARSFQLRLEVLTYTEPAVVRRELGNATDLQVFHRLSDADVQERLRRSWAIFLPTSFDSSVQTMTRTSFPSKLSESCRAGRPLLVYGPPEASLPRYFREQNLPGQVTSRAHLAAGLEALVQADQPDTIRRYQAAFERLHSAEALKTRLGVYPPGTGGAGGCDL